MASEGQASKYSEPIYAKPDKKKTDYPFYNPNIEKYLIPDVRAKSDHLFSPRLTQAA